MSKRHSAVLGENHAQKAAPQVPLRSSAIFRRNNDNKGEPVLTDYTNRSDNGDILRQRTPPQTKPKQGTSSFVKNLDFLRPRREKTESVILVKNTAARQLYAQQHQVTKIETKMGKIGANLTNIKKINILIIANTN